MKLTVGNSLCKIEGYSQEQFKELRALLSYTSDPKAQFYAGFRGSNRKYLITKRGDFPTGLLFMVLEWAAGKSIELIDTRVEPVKLKKPLKLSLQVTPYPEQTNAALACLNASRGIVVAPTGVGKSVIIALIINNLQVKTLLVVPSLELKRQLTKFLGAVFGKAAIGREITVENVDALEVGDSAGGYGCVIIDEFHRSGAETYRKLNQKSWGGVFYKFGLTATPFRSQDHEKILLESVLSEVIYQVDYSTAVEKGYIVPMEAFFYTLPKREVEGYSWQQVYKELVVNNGELNALICNALTTLSQGGKSTLCLVKEIAHGELLAKATGVPFANGLADDTAELIAAFSSGKIKALIATTGVCGEGVDTKPAEYIIIAGLGKSKNALMQQFGRGFRTYPGKESCKIILFNNKSHKWTVAHFREQCKILRGEYGVTPVELT